MAFVETAELMWRKLKKRSVVANALKVHQLKTSLVESKQGGMDVVKYYAKPMEFWSELENQV